MEKNGQEENQLLSFYKELALKNSRQLNFSIEFEINGDKQKEEMNKNLKYNKIVFLYNKEHKCLALNILNEIGDNNRSKNHINEVFYILISSKRDKN